MPVVLNEDLTYLTTVDRLTGLLVALKPDGRKFRRLRELIEEYQQLNEIVNRGETADEATRLRAQNRMAEIQVYPKKLAPPKPAVISEDLADWNCDSLIEVGTLQELVADVLHRYGPKAKIQFDAGANNVQAVVHYPAELDA